ncbi:hypothetical protein GE21DRAFT_1304334 [Neurospora crassa]|nr:hypothetical protein GE21DRAFT_1304334 [Neurospora crassa]
MDFHTLTPPAPQCFDLLICRQSSNETATPGLFILKMEESQHIYQPFHEANF